MIKLYGGLADTDVPGGDFRCALSSEFLRPLQVKSLRKEGNHVKYICNFSGGLTSFWATKLCVDKHGLENVEIWFADVKTEEPDLYRFNCEIEEAFGWKIERFSDGRNIWELFNDEHMIGNSQASICSRILKRELLRRVLTSRYSPNQATVVIGMSWDEYDRINDSRTHQLPYATVFPCADREYGQLTDKCEISKYLDMNKGIKPPQLYADGFPHGNCGGFCVRAGMAQFQELLKRRPKTYAYHEQQERLFRERFNKDVSVLRDRRNKTTKPMTLEAFRLRVEAGEDFSKEEWGGCGCFAPEETT